MRAQHLAVSVFIGRQVERVVILARGVFGGNVECGEIVEIGLDMRAFGDGETHLAEDRDHLVDGLADRVDTAFGRRARRQRDVDAILGKAGIQRRCFENLFTRVDCGGNGILDGIQLLAGIAALFRRQLADPLDHSGDRTGLAKRRDAQCLQRRKVCGLYLRKHICL